MNAPRERFRVWDAPVRLFHWSLAILVALQWATGQYHLLSMRWHYGFGYALLALLLFRVLWGFFGSDNARFAHFVRSPAAVIHYLRVTARTRKQAQVGHNPLGAWSVLSMMAVLLVQSLTGLFTSDEIDEFGPFAEKVSDSTMKLMSGLHAATKNVLLVLIALHVVGIAYHALAKGDDLIGPMITGRKALPADPQLRFAGTLRALLLAAVSAIAVWAVLAAAA